MCSHGNVPLQFAAALYELRVEMWRNLRLKGLCRWQCCVQIQTAEINCTTGCAAWERTTVWAKWLAASMGNVKQSGNTFLMHFTLSSFAEKTIY